MENPTLEQEISAIEQKLAEKKAELNKEEVHTVVKEQIQEKAPEYQPSISPMPVTDGSQNQALPATPPPTANVPAYLSDELKNKVQELVNIAFTQSIADAVKAATKLNNPALIDAFHDILVDQLYNTLVERGKLKKM
ncbi:MAG: hypothetical protein A3C71_02490 [Candidatus Yanofskybacteria bacterium RIFCSPHIGHO2_02_FULL_43_15c]|uniref:Uncharacterized protein n=1 Tax=Candidatus Yanofskybacteria bacterium RIFCSPHIGHO2_02_FULL_43_15c TaxID=1802679 RepID=A0A1F8FK92_9BACT|nr:MAG: hypothetical protein A3C71_02490 [Candidatus Yanofskybacteria bacterium RIFCSPHIGHO2_02_FULL_43_15c]